MTREMSKLIYNSFHDDRAATATANSTECMHVLDWLGSAGFQLILNKILAFLEGCF